MEAKVNSVGCRRRQISCKGGALRCMTCGTAAKRRRDFYRALIDQWTILVATGEPLTAITVIIRDTLVWNCDDQV